jgi:hypothetical protein
MLCMLGNSTDLMPDVLRIITRFLYYPKLFFLTVVVRQCMNFSKVMTSGEINDE